MPPNPSIFALASHPGRAGVAAVHIEDQPYPKLAGYHRGEGTLAPIEVTVSASVPRAAAAPSNSARPSSVSATARVERLNSRTPKLFSSVCTRSCVSRTCTSAFVTIFEL